MRLCAQLKSFGQTLSLAQNMDAQMWRSYQIGHTESEHRGWVGAFNTTISLGSVYERLLNWEGMDFVSEHLTVIFRCVSNK